MNHPEIQSLGYSRGRLLLAFTAVVFSPVVSPSLPSAPTLYASGHFPQSIAHDMRRGCPWAYEGRKRADVIRVFLVDTSLYLLNAVAEILNIYAALFTVEFPKLLSLGQRKNNG